MEVTVPTEDLCEKLSALTGFISRLGHWVRVGGPAFTNSSLLRSFDSSLSKTLVTTCYITDNQTESLRFESERMRPGRFSSRRPGTKRREEITLSQTHTRYCFRNSFVLAGSHKCLFLRFVADKFIRISPAPTRPKLGTFISQTCSTGRQLCRQVIALAGCRSTNIRFSENRAVARISPLSRESNFGLQGGDPLLKAYRTKASKR